MRTMKIVLFSLVVVATIFCISTDLRAGGAVPKFGGKAVRSDSKVSGTAKVAGAESGKQKVTIKLAVTPDWYIYANEVNNKELDDNKTIISFYEGGKLVAAKVIYPAGEVKADSMLGTYAIYKGQIDVSAVLDRPADAKGALEVRIAVNSCSGNTCLQPGTLTLRVE